MQFNNVCKIFLNSVQRVSLNPIWIHRYALFLFYLRLPTLSFLTSILYNPNGSRVIETIMETKCFNEFVSALRLALILTLSLWSLFTTLDNVLLSSIKATFSSFCLRFREPLEIMSLLDNLTKKMTNIVIISYLTI